MTVAKRVAFRKEGNTSLYAIAFQRVSLGPSGWSIDFLDCEEVVDGLGQICRGWNIQIATDRHRSPNPCACISFKDGQWLWRKLGAAKPRDWDRLPPKSPMRVLTDIQDAVLHWLLDEKRRGIGLHAAAARIGNSLVCFPARGFAGKSTLMACLARRGHRVFGDDVIIITKQGTHGASLGFSPRLRMPFPADLSPRTMEFIRTRANPASHGWAYLSLNDQAVANLMEDCRIDSVVLLVRAAGSPARLEPADRLDVLKVLLAEHLPGRQPLPLVFDRMKRLATSANCYRLTFGSADKAAAILERHIA
jgi:hypothetical protein